MRLTAGGFKRGQQFSRCLVAPRRRLLKRFHHHAFERGRDEPVVFAGQRRSLVKDGADQLGTLRLWKRALASGHLVEHGSRGVNVAARIGRFAPQLFWRHVWQRPRNAVHLRDGARHVRFARRLE